MFSRKFYEFTKYALFQFTLFVMASPAFALQKVTVNQDEHVTVSVSKHGINTLKIEQEPIETMIAPNNIEVQSNAKTGDVIFKLIEPVQTDVVVISEFGKKYLLKLMPADASSESIVLVPNGSLKDKLAQGDPYPKVLSELLIAMYNVEQLEGYRIEVIGKRHGKVKSVPMTHVASYVGASIQGEIFEIKNTSKASLHLKELDFYTDNVRAVALVSHDLEPGEITRVFLIRSNV